MNFEKNLLQKIFWAHNLLMSSAGTKPRVGEIKKLPNQNLLHIFCAKSILLQNTKRDLGIHICLAFKASRKNLIEQLGTEYSNQ